MREHLHGLATFVIGCAIFGFGLLIGGWIAERPPVPVSGVPRCPKELVLAFDTELSHLVCAKPVELQP